MENLKVHITGGKGFIGRGVQRGLQDRFRVTVSDVDDLNVLDKAKVIDWFKALEPDLVIHLAGLMGAQSSKKRLYDYFAVNSLGVLNVLEAAYQAGTRHFILLSSLTVHGFNNSPAERITEKSAFRPNHTYATSKVVAEYMVRDYARFYGLNAVILRPSIVVGNLEGEENSVNEFCRNAITGKTTMLYGDGQHEREFLSLDDIVVATECSIEFLLRSRDNKGICEEFIVSSGQPISMVNLATRCIEILDGGKLSFVEKQVQAYSLTADVTKAHKVLGWRPKDDIDAIIRDTASKLKGS